jgi:hypothetical protein
MLGDVMKNYQEAKASDEVIRDILSMKPKIRNTTSSIQPKQLESL